MRKNVHTKGKKASRHGPNTLPKSTSLGSVNMTIPLGVGPYRTSEAEQTEDIVVRDYHMWAKKVQAR